MPTSEWCAVAHVDISPRTSLEYGVQLLEALAANAASQRGVIEVAVLRQPVRQNHFEILGRYDDEAGYLTHLASESNRTFRREIAPMLGSPYEDRLHQPRDGQGWPAAQVGDFVVVTQLELLPETADAATSDALGELEAVQKSAAGLVGQVFLERPLRPNNLELISVWTSPEDFEAHLATPESIRSRAGLSGLLVAPIDDRPHHVLAGSLTTA